MSDSDVHESAERSCLLTLVFTDLVNSVGLKTRLGDTEAGRLITTHHEGIRTLAKATQGREILVAGDGSFLTFETPSHAVGFALRLQDFHRRNPNLPHVRVGIHMGEVTERTSSGHAVQIDGLAVDIASRIQSLGHERQILMSYPVFDNARQRLDNSQLPLPVEWRAHGRYVFQGIDIALEIYEAGLKGIATFTSPTGSSKAQRDVHSEEEATLGWRPAQGLELPGRPKWVLVEKLGEGGFGDVWMAEHRKTRDRHVIKFCYSPDRLRALKREVTLFRLLKETLGDRPDIARVLDYQFDTMPYFLEMEFAGHHNLTSWMEEHGGVQAIPLETRLELVAQVADAIAAAHSVGVLHKDIKPSNIMVTESRPENPRIRMIDFGIGAVSDRHLLDVKGITATGLTEAESSGEYASSMAGTRLYMAPELIEGKTATTKSDIYSLGVLLYQLASGKLGQALSFGWERDIPDEILREDIEACVDGRPENRLASAEELASRLRNLPQRHEKRRLAEENTQRLATVKHRRKILYGIAALLGIMLIIIAQFAAIQLQKAHSEEQLRKKAEAAQLDALQQNELTRQALQKAQQAGYFGAIALAEAGLRESRFQKVQEVLLNETPHDYLHREWGWLLAQTAPEDFALDHHNIFDTAFSPDGKTIITGDRDSTGKGHLIIYDAATAKPLADIKTNNRLVWNLALSPNGRLAATASSDKEVAVVDLTSQTVIHRLRDHNGIVRDVAFSPDGKWLASCARDHTIRIWDTDTFSKARTIRVENDRFTELSFSPDSKYIVTGSLEGVVRVFEIDTARQICDLTGNNERVLSVNFLKNGKGIATACSVGVTHIYPWPPPSGQSSLPPALSIRSRASYPSQVVSSPDGEALYIGHDNGQIIKVDTTSGTELLSIRIDQPLWKMTLSDDGKKLMTTARWSSRMLDLERLEESCEVSPWTDETTIPSNAALIKTAGVLEIRDTTWSEDVEWRSTSGLSLITTSNGKRFIAQSAYDIYSPDRSVHIKIDPDTLQLVVRATADNTLLLPLSQKRVTTAAFSPDGAQAAIALDPAGTAVYDTRTWQQLFFIPDQGIAPGKLIYTPDSKTLIIGDVNGDISSYDAASGKLIQNLMGKNRGAALSLDVSKDGRYLAAGFNTDRAIVLDIKTGDSVSTMTGHVRYIVGVKFAPNDQRLVTLSRDSTVKMWDVKTGRELVTLFSLPDGETPLGIAFGPTGRGISIATSNHRVVGTDVFPWDLNEYPGQGHPLEKRVELWKRQQRLNPTLTMEDITAPY